MNRVRAYVIGGAGGGSSNAYWSNDQMTDRYFVDDTLLDAYVHTSTGDVKFAGDSVIVLFGDSLEQHSGTGSITAGSEEFSNWSRGAINWCRMLDPRGCWFNWHDASRASKFFIGQNVGISGNETSQMAARKTDVTNIVGGKVLIMGGGTNDINASRLTADIMTDLEECADAAFAAGMKLILMTPPPRTTSGTSSWPAGGAKRTEWMTLCDAMQAYVDEDPDNRQIVRRDMICSNGDADRTPIAGYLQPEPDNTHLTPTGGHAVAVGTDTYPGLIDALAQWVEPFYLFPAAVTTGDLSPNPTMTGTSGTAGTGTTGQVATSFTVQRQSGSTGVTCVASKDVDGSQKLVFTRDGTGGTVALFTVGRTINSPVPRVGSWYRGWLKFRAAASTAFQQISLQTRGQPSTPANSNHYAMKVDTGMPWPSVDFTAGHWQACPPFKTRVGTTSVIFLVNITIDNSTAGTDTVWVDRLHLVPVPEPTQRLGYE